jgi:hypothetical protein
MKKFKWNVTIEVDRTWVANGFTTETIQRMLEAVLPNAYRYAFTAKVTKAPTPESIKAAQVGEE